MAMTESHYWVMGYINPEDTYPCLPIPVVEENGEAKVLLTKGGGSLSAQPLESGDDYTPLGEHLELDLRKSRLLAHSRERLEAVPRKASCLECLSILSTVEDPLRRYLLARKLIDVAFGDFRAWYLTRSLEAVGNTVQGPSPEFLNWLAEEKSKLNHVLPPGSRSRIGVRSLSGSVEIVDLETGSHKRLGQGQDYELSLSPDVYLARFGMGQESKEYFAAGDQDEEDLVFGAGPEGTPFWLGELARKELRVVVQFCQNAYGSNLGDPPAYDLAVQAGKKALRLSQAVGATGLARLAALSLANAYGIGTSQSALGQVQVGSKFSESLSPERSLSSGFHYLFSKGENAFGPETSQAVPSHGEMGKVVVVDDEPQFFDYIRKCFSGAEAKLYYRETADQLQRNPLPGKPSLVVLDLMLGAEGISGSARALDTLRQRYGMNLPVLLVTSRVARHDPQLTPFLSFGAVGFCDKRRLLSASKAILQDTKHLTTLASLDPESI